MYNSYIMGKSIPEYKELIKRLINNDAIFMAILLIVVGICSFTLGQQSMVRYAVPITPRVSLLASPVVTVEHEADIYNEFVSASTTTLKPTSVEKLKYTASKSGTKYHFLTCPGAKQIKDENKIYFSSTAEAESAGYTPASNCPGL